MLQQGIPTWMNVERQMMRKLWVKAKMAEMMYWTLKRYLQIPFWDIKVRWMAQLLLVRTQGSYHHALLFIGHLRLLKHSSVNQSLILLTTLFSGVSSPFAQYLQKEARFTKDVLCPHESCHSRNTVVVKYESMGGSFIKIIWMMELVHTKLLWIMPNNSLISAKDVLKKTYCRNWVSQNTGWLGNITSSSTIFYFWYVILKTLGVLMIPSRTTSVILKLSLLATHFKLGS